MDVAVLSDRSRSDAIVASALKRDRLLTAGQRRNVLLKADDLHDARRVWSSVPFRVHFEPNRRCNVKCLHCDIPRGGTGDLDLALLEKLMDEAGFGVTELLPYVGGEPSLAPMERVAALARKHGAWLSFTTNGQLFTRAYHAPIADVTSRVCFSFHAHEPDLYRRIMPGLDYDVAVQNLRDLVELGAAFDTQVVPTCVVLHCNLDTLAEYVRFVHRVGVRRVIFQKLYPHSKVYAQESVHARRSAQEVAERVRHVLDTALKLGVFVETNVDEIFGDPRNVEPRRNRFDVLHETTGLIELYHPGFCILTATTVLIEWDGTLIPCCRDHIVLGNLHESHFGELWTGPVMQRLRESFFRRQPSPHCAECMAFYNGHA